MKPPILLLAVISAVAFSSCTTAYKTGQTPDDVYFSPVTPEDEYVRVEKKDDKRYVGSDEYYDDRYLRMRVRNRARWSELDDYYFNGRSSFSYYNYSYFNTWGIHNPWNPYTYWNCAYNPYFHGNVIIGPTSPTYSKPRFFNLNAYNNNSLTNNTYNPKASNINIRGGSGTTFGNNSYNNSNRGSNAGSFLRDIFSGGSNSSGKSNSGSSSGSNNNSSSSGSSSGSKGSSAPTRRF